jgi:hypothetical protein
MKQIGGSHLPVTFSSKRCLHQAADAAAKTLQVRILSHTLYLVDI